MTRLRILLADDHAVVLEGLRRILDSPNFLIAGAVQDGRALVEAAVELNPDLIIVDITLPSLNGIEAARQIFKQRPRAKIIFLTMHPEVVYGIQAMSSGAAGYVLKSAAGDELLTAIREVRRGRIYITPSLREPVMEALMARRKKPEMITDGLTPRQREVLQLLAEGKKPKEIAVLLSVSSRTVEFHKYRMMEVLGLRTVAELAGYAVRHGIVR